MHHTCTVVGLARVGSLSAMLRELHAGFGWVVIVTNGIAGAWALAAHSAKSLRTPWLWRFTALAQSAIAVQVMLGVGVMQSENIEPTGIHMFYGFVALATAALIYSYRQQLKPWQYQLYGWGGLFLMGLAIRSALNTPTL